MESPFDITVTGDTIVLQEGRHEKTITVTNKSGKALTAHAELLCTKDVAPWLSIATDSERHFPTTATEQFVVKVNVPPTAPEGDYSFVLRVADVDDPNEIFTNGPVIKFKVTAKPVVVDPPPPPKKWLYILLGAIFLILMVSVVLWVLLRNKGVPDVVGNTYEDAEIKLEGAGLTPRKVLKRAEQPDQQGKVMAQDPKAGAETPEDKVVTLDVGSERIRLKNLTTRNVREVVEELNKMGLFLIRIVPATGTQPLESIIDQDPRENIEVVPESRITLTVREDAVKPPPLTGKSLGNAVKEARSAGFLCCWVETSRDGSGADFEVIKQDPPADTPTSRANKIKLVIREGPSAVALKEFMNEYKVDMEPR